VDGKLIEPAEGYSKAVDKPSYVQALKGRGIDVAFAETDTGTGAKEPPKPSGAVKR
jgi:hypothetical protein